MTHPLDFEALEGLLHQCTAHWPDHRTEGPNTRYAIPDAASDFRKLPLAAFCDVFARVRSQWKPTTNSKRRPRDLRLMLLAVRRWHAPLAGFGRDSGLRVTYRYP
jgi:hypothetical protein